MSCDVTKFTITKGSDNTFNFTIKQDNSTLPLTITESDTFFADLVQLSDDTPYTPVTNKALVVEDPANGKVSLTITAAETDNNAGVALVKESGSKVDRYYLRPTYKLTLRCSTVNNGDFIVKVPEVYVD
jgi:hypothetical protein